MCRVVFSPRWSFTSRDVGNILAEASDLSRALSGMLDFGHCFVLLLFSISFLYSYQWKLWVGKLKKEALIQFNLIQERGAAGWGLCQRWGSSTWALKGSEKPTKMKEDLKPEPGVLFVPCNNTVRILRSSDINEELDFPHFTWTIQSLKIKRWTKTMQLLIQLYIFSSYSLKCSVHI